LNETINICECPRDAIQGIKEFIPTEIKAKYLNHLIRVGYDKLDFGSFVSPKAIPQLKDTADVLDKLELNQHTNLLAIIANERGAKDACEFEEINFLGFPFSVSEIFQQRNTNASLEKAFYRLQNIADLAHKHSKNLQVYLSMGFGNPYGEKWHPEIVLNWSERLSNLNVKHVALSDTIGCSTKESITFLFQSLKKEISDITYIAHLHSTPNTSMSKIQASYDAGCRHFDSAIKGFGGCPMAKDDLTGNIATEKLFEFMSLNGIKHNYNIEAFKQSLHFSSQVF